MIRTALSIMQPWAWLICAGIKDVENRTWQRSYRGRVLIHAGKTLDREAMDALSFGEHPVTGRILRTIWEERADSPPRGGIVGIAEIVGCVSRSESPWFVGPYGFVVRDARELPFIPCKGALGFFEPTLSPEQWAAIDKEIR